MCTITLGLSIVASYAWFAAGRPLAFGDSTNEANIIGGSDASYYESGSGTQADPYIISDKIHLYNLSWLQYIGYYNAFKSFNAAAADDIVQCYFSVSKDIDMGGLTIPPIGTEKYPFLGNFDGGNYTISNFTISNDDPTSAGSDYGIAKPQNFYAGEPSDVIGFFGVVGALPNQSITYDSSITSFKNFTLEDFTIKSRTNELLIGLAAGYVDGPISNVKIDGSATLDINGQTSTAKSNITSKLSDYGLVGYTTHTASAGSYTQDLSEFYNNDDSGGGGEGDEWGGSINPRVYSRKIYDNYKGTNSNGLETSGISQNTDYTINSNPTNDFKIAFRMTTSRTYPYNASSYTYYSDPDYFNNPQDGKSVRTKIYSVLYHLRDGGYTPLRFNDDKTDTHQKNTGYIVGSSSGNAGSPKISSGYISNIGNAISNTSIATTGNASNNYLDMTYNDANMDVITYSTKDNNWYLVKDSHNQNHTPTNTTVTNLNLSTKTVEQLGFEKYDASRESLKNVLETAPRLNAIKFDNTVVSSSNLLNVTSGTIRVNNQTFVTSSSSPYQFPKGSIDFNLKKTGYINFFAGTYYYSQTMNNFAFFTLNHIFRTGGTINSIKKISEIYQNKYWSTSELSNSQTNPKFFYKYSDGTFSNIYVNGSTRAATLADRDTSKGDDGMVFNTSYALESPIGTSNASLFKKAVNNLVFYFEVPVNDGEYAMGMASNPNSTTITSFTGAYLMYLDIGANGDTIDKDLVQARYVTTQKAGNSYPVGVDFIPITVSGNGGDSIAVSIDSGEKGVLTFAVSSNDISVTDSSSVSQYAYRSSNYSSSSPSSTQFTCNLSGDPPSTLGGGTRVLTINLTMTDDDEHEIVITDYLLDNAGSFNESDSLFVVDGATSSKAAIIALSTEIDITAFRGLTKVVTLTRTAGTGEFTTEYDRENSSYDNKKIDVDLTLYGTTVSVGTITANYSFFVGGVQKYANNVIS